MADDLSWQPDAPDPGRWSSPGMPAGSGSMPSIDSLAFAQPHFWTAHGKGLAILSVAALAQAAAGLAGVVSFALVWYLAAPRENFTLPLLASALAAAAGGVSYPLIRSENAQSILFVRGWLPLVDLVVASMLLWALPRFELAPALFVVPIVLAALLLSWRAGALFATLAVATFGTISVLRLGLDYELWAAQTIGLGIVAGIIAAVTGIVWQRIERASDALLREWARLRDDLTRKEAAQRRLIEHINTLEDGQLRLEQERVQMNIQIAELATAAQRIAQGDSGAIRIIRPGLIGPMESLGGWLTRLAQQVSGYPAAQQQAQTYRQTLERLDETIREQERLLDQTQRALHALAASANEHVAYIQRLQRGSGELPGINRHALFAQMQGIEQNALTQASDTAMLGARIQQLQAQNDLLRQRLRASGITGESAQPEDATRRTGGVVRASAHIPATPQAVPAWPTQTETRPPATANARRNAEREL